MFQKTFHEMMNCCSKCSKCIITLNSVPSHPCIFVHPFIPTATMQKDNQQKMGSFPVKQKKGFKIKR